MHTSVDAVAITVSSIETALPFYTKVLPFERVSDQTLSGAEVSRLLGVRNATVRVVRLRLGQEFVELIDFIGTDGRTFPETESNDRWFQHVAIIVRDMDKAYERLQANDVHAASIAPQRLPDWNHGAAGIQAYYFRDPDGHFLEILSFPAGKGDPKWHRPTDKLFLGIDHTAIVVDDTERSLALYKDHLGFAFAGEGENYGIEQERLNNVFPARLRITTLKAPGGGIKVELLEYLSPRTGRAMPVDSRANDLWHWHIRLSARHFDALTDDLRAIRAPWISPGTVKVPGGAFGIRRGLAFRDPDGHALLLGDPVGSR